MGEIEQKNEIVMDVYQNLKTQTRDAVSELGSLKDTYKHQSEVFVYEVQNLETKMNEISKTL